MQICISNCNHITDSVFSFKDNTTYLFQKFLPVCRLELKLHFHIGEAFNFRMGGAIVNYETAMSIL